jgi:peroxiredoxin
MATADVFNVEAIPTAFVIDRSGRIRFVHAGYGLETVDVFRQEIASLLDTK